MKAFAAAGILASASAASAQTEVHAAVNSLFNASRYYSYGYGDHAYPEFDHKEELSPVKEHKKARSYRTSNIDIFAHSDSEESEENHGSGYGHHDSHSSHSSSSEDEHHHKAHHHVFLTGEGPEGNHCHEGDYCPSDSASDYTDSDY